MPSVKSTLPDLRNVPLGKISSKEILERTTPETQRVKVAAFNASL
jgi:hypothetical protein